MGAILISPQSIEEQQLLLALLKRMGISARILSEEEEDEALGLLMKEADVEDKVERNEIMHKLRRA
ncbi:MAG: hypothetical protein H7246_14185 [Phycisphaerae bacterium]|nr:hypothetical protein [Saprospiraceae bacterium]